jgi:outer membrane protein/protease secretion system outer membrane protein
MAGACSGSRKVIDTPRQRLLGVRRVLFWLAFITASWNGAHAQPAARIQPPPTPPTSADDRSGGIDITQALHRGVERLQEAWGRTRKAWDDTVGTGLNEAGAGTPRWEPPAVQPPAAAQVDASRPLGLLQTWQAALVNDPSLRAARAAAVAGRERLPQAQAQLRPSLSFSASRFKNESERDSVNFLGVPQTTNERYFSQNETLTLRQPLYRQPQEAALRQAAYLVQDVEAVLARETQNLGIRVTGIYLEALLSRDQLALVQSQKAFLTTQLDAARRGLAAGTGTRTDVDEVQARLDLNRAQELEALQQVELSRRQVQALVNRPVGELARLDAVRLVLQVPQPASLDEWVALAVAASPEVRSLQAQRDAAREEMAKARAGHLPTLDLVAQLQRSRSENFNSPQSGYVNSSLGLQLNVPLYQGGYVNSVSRQVQAEYLRMGELLDALRLDLGIRVHKEYRGVTEGIARVRALEVAERSAEVAVDSARKSVAAGTRTVVDVLNAEQQRMQVLRDLAQARYMTLMSTVRLEALAGRVDEGLMARVGAALGS